jgi:PhzF family phenazine biosynthesis protein
LIELLVIYINKGGIVLKYYIVDAFTNELFKGNQAGVCLLDEWLNDEIMQNIASENNLAETAFVVKRNDYYDLRWFSPETEIDLCGHATLASAFVISNFVDNSREKIDFHTMSGKLSVEKKADLFEMDFPARMPTPIPITQLMEEAIGVSIQEAHLSRDMLLLVDSEQQVKNLRPDLSLISKVSDCFALIVTAKGEQVDFVSRFFAPNAGIPEDPVTGSSHCTLIPFWAQRLKKEEMVAKQLSKRGGTLYCGCRNDRVIIAGKATLYLRGDIRTQ